MKNWVGGGKTALAEVNALKPRVSALENKPVGTQVIVDSRNNGSTWYKKFSDGFIMQGGVITCPYSNTEYAVVDVSFPVPFRTTNYSVAQCNMGLRGERWNYSSHISKRATSSMTLDQVFKEKYTVSWMTFGY